MRTVLRTLVSLLIVATFVALGLSGGLLFSLSGSGLGTIAGGGHGAQGSTVAAQRDALAFGGTAGFLLALAVVWGISRHHAPSRWFGALVVSALVLLLAGFIPAWHDPLYLEIVVLSVPVICGVFLHAEARAARERHGEPD